MFSLREIMRFQEQLRHVDVTDFAAHLKRSPKEKHPRKRSLAGGRKK